MSRLPLANRTSTVSSCIWCYFLHVLTIRSKLVEPDRRIGSRVESLERIPLLPRLPQYPSIRLLSQSPLY